MKGTVQRGPSPSRLWRQFAAGGQFLSGAAPGRRRNRSGRVETQLPMS